eukprot:jgi/Chlat1/4351/Chrsp29S04504
MVQGGAGPPAAVAASEPNRTTLIAAMSLYALSSSVMLVLNKGAVTFIPAPAALLFLQLAASAFLAFCLGKIGAVEVDAFDWQKASCVRKFWPVAVVFLSTIFTNIKTLQNSSVNMFIILRCSTPLLIAFLDSIFLGRELPSKRSWASLVAILVGALAYVVSKEGGVPMVAIGWACLWYATFALDMVYIKHVVDTVPMHAWGRVLYQNTLALPILLCLFLIGGEYTTVGVASTKVYSMKAIVVVLASCICGAGLSWSAFSLRALVSATTFTVVGIVCKMATVLIAALSLSNEVPNPAGLFGLVACILASTFYQQSPKRQSPVEPGRDLDQDKDVEKVPLMSKHADVQKIEIKVGDSKD